MSQDEQLQAELPAYSSSTIKTQRKFLLFHPLLLCLFFLAGSFPEPLCTYSRLVIALLYGALFIALIATDVASPCCPSCNKSMFYRGIISPDTHCPRCGDNKLTTNWAGRVYCLNCSEKIWFNGGIPLFALKHCMRCGTLISKEGILSGSTRIQIYLLKNINKGFREASSSGSTAVPIGSESVVSKVVLE